MRKITEYSPIAPEGFKMRESRLLKKTLSLKKLKNFTPDSLNSS